MNKNKFQSYALTNSVLRASGRRRRRQVKIDQIPQCRRRTGHKTHDVRRHHRVNKSCIAPIKHCAHRAHQKKNIATFIKRCAYATAELKLISLEENLICFFFFFFRLRLKCILFFNLLCPFQMRRRY